MKRLVWPCALGEDQTKKHDFHKEAHYENILSINGRLINSSECTCLSACCHFVEWLNSRRGREPGNEHNVFRLKQLE